MKSRNYLNITLPDLTPHAAFALVCWLESFTHEVSLYYSDEVRSELQRRDDEVDAHFDDFDDTIPF